MRTLPHLQTRIFDTPLAIQPAKMEVILSVLGDRIGLEIDADALEAARSFQPAERKSYSITQDGIAVIPIQGTLMKKASGLMAMSGTASYEEITSQLKSAIASPDVKGILLDIDSPGGETHGLFDLADYIFSLRGEKPIYAVANDGAYSAAYAIASSADKIYVTRTGGVGSIGVFSLHVDQSKADEKAGLKYTYIKAGEKKAEGNPHEPLSESAEADAQAEVDREYQMFCSLVARNRKVSLERVMNTEAGVYFAENAVPLLADEVGTFEDALAAITTLNSSAKTPAVSFKRTGAHGTTLNISDQTKSHEEVKKPMAQLNDGDLELNAKKADEADEAEEAKKGKKAEEANEAKECDADDYMDDEDGDDKKKDDDDDEEADAKKATTITRIVNLCTLAGHADLAASFIGKGMTVAQVEKALLEQRSMKSNQTKVNTNLTPFTSAFDGIQSGVNALAKEKNIRKSEAYAEFLMNNPHLYDAYIDERDTAIQTAKGAKQYLAAMKTKLGVRGN